MKGKKRKFFKPNETKCKDVPSGEQPMLVILSEKPIQLLGLGHW